MRFLETEIPGVVVVEPLVHRDGRGFFLETYHELRYREHGIPERQYLKEPANESCPGAPCRSPGGLGGVAGELSVASRPRGCEGRAIPFTSGRRPGGIGEEVSAASLPPTIECPPCS